VAVSATSLFSEDFLALGRLPTWVIE